MATHTLRERVAHILTLYPMPTDTRKAFGDALEQYADELLPLRNDLEAERREKAAVSRALGERNREVLELRSAEKTLQLSVDAARKIIADRCETIATLESQVYALTRTINENAGLHTRECDRLREDVEQRNKQIVELEALVEMLKRGSVMFSAHSGTETGRTDSSAPHSSNTPKASDDCYSNGDGKGPYSPNGEGTRRILAAAAADNSCPPDQAVIGALSKVVGLDITTAIHCLRNPHGWHPNSLEKVRHFAADKLEELTKACNHAADVRVAVRRLVDVLDQ